MRTAVRFPTVAPGAAHYESVYLKTARDGRGVWIRHTVLKRAGENATGAIWFTSFDAGSAPRAIREPARPSVPADGYIRVGDAVLGPGRARGSVADAAWDLEFADDSEPLHHLPHDLLYRARLPRTKLLSPYPNARFTGTIRIGDEELALDGWPGMVGHNWGTEHAARWVWIQCNALDGVDAYVDVAAGRLAVGHRTTPWIANGILHLDGEPLRLGGLNLRRTRIAETPSACDFELGGRDVRVHGRVSAPEEAFVEWDYAGPDGSSHRVRNCSIAELTLTVERDGRPPRRLEARGSAAYELGVSG